MQNSTDPLGNQTSRTLDGYERVTCITYPTITHTDPDQTITESFAYLSNGMLETQTDGEGAVTIACHFGTPGREPLRSRCRCT